MHTGKQLSKGLFSEEKRSDKVMVYNYTISSQHFRHGKLTGSLADLDDLECLEKTMIT